MLAKLPLFIKKAFVIFEPFILIKYHPGPNIRIEKHFMIKEKDDRYNISPPLPTSPKLSWIHKNDERIQDTCLNYESWSKRLANLLRYKSTILMRHSLCEYGCGQVREYKVIEATPKLLLLKGTIDFECTIESTDNHEFWVAKDDPRICKPEKKVLISEKDESQDTRSIYEKSGGDFIIQ